MLYTPAQSDTRYNSMKHTPSPILFSCTSLLGAFFAQGALLSDFDGNGVLYLEGGTIAPGITAGGPTGSFYRLLDNVESLQNFLAFSSDGTDPEDDFTDWTEVTYTMDFRMDAIGADGFGINFLSTDTHGHSGVIANTNGAGTGDGGPAERAFMPDAFGFGIRVYQGRNSTVTFDDSLVANDVEYTYNDGVWGSLEISIVRNPVTKDALVNVTLYDEAGLAGNAQPVHSDVNITGVIVEDFRVQIGARTGGLNMTLDLDNIALEIKVPDPTDTDGDGLPNEWEIEFGLDPDDDGEAGDPDQGASGDPDSDTLTNAEEYSLGTNPTSDDSDGDGLKDNVEDDGGIYVGPNQTGTSPRLDDTDRDGLKDGNEVPTEDYVDANQSGTDPNKVDTDEDGFADGTEILLGRNPKIVDVLTPAPDLVADFDGNGESFEEEARRGARKGQLVVGDANSDGNYYQLLENIGNAGNFISFESTEDYTGWQNFSFQMDYLASNVAADGFGVNFLSTADHGDSGVIPLVDGTVEERALIDNSFGVGFRTFQATNATVTWNSVDVSLDAPYTLPQDNWASVGIDVERDPGSKDALVNVFVYDLPDRQGNAENVFADFSIPAMDLEDFRVQVAGRTGGSAMNLSIDNIKVFVDGGGQSGIVISSINTVVVPGAGNTPDTLSVTITWNSREGRTYAILASDDLGGGDLDFWDELEDSFLGAVGQETTSFTESGISIDTQKRFYVVRIPE
ncbi:MAG: hypothetical protein ACJAVK_001394 [Akkermansiaceae bacterium]